MESQPSTSADSVLGSRFHPWFLIEEVSKYPELYNTDHNGYSRSDVRNAAWLKIALAVSRSTDPTVVSALKTKWKNLRDTFVKRRRIKNCGPWKHEKKMSFLQPYIKDNTRMQTMTSGKYPATPPTTTVQEAALNHEVMNFSYWERDREMYEACKMDEDRRRTEALKNLEQLQMELMALREHCTFIEPLRPNALTISCVKDVMLGPLSEEQPLDLSIPKDLEGPKDSTST